MPKTDTPAAEPGKPGRAPATALPPIVAVALNDVPADPRSGPDLTNEETAYAAGVVAILNNGEAAKGAGFVDRAAAENSSRRVRRMVAKLGGIPETKTARSSIAADIDGSFAWYLRLGDPSKAGRKADAGTAAE